MPTHMPSTVVYTEIIGLFANISTMILRRCGVVLAPQSGIPARGYSDFGMSEGGVWNWESTSRAVIMQPWNKNLDFSDWSGFHARRFLGLR